MSLAVVLMGLCSPSWAQLDQLTIVDDVVQISTADDLQAFARAVNEGNTTLDAVLTQDIECENVTMIGTDAIYYAGTFDGQYHKLTYTLTSNESGTGLFRSLSGTVKNLEVAGELTMGSNLCGTIAGRMYGGTISHCVSSVNITSNGWGGDAAWAGIASRASSTTEPSIIEYCIYSGTISGDGVFNCAGILGWVGDNCSGKVTNCLYTGDMLIAGDTGDNKCYNICRRESLAPCTNCYYVNKILDGEDEFTHVNAGSIQVTAEQVASGALCFLANGSKSNEECIWRQNLGADATPVPFPAHGVVYASGDIRCDGAILEGASVEFSNNGSTVIPDHHYVDGICSVCGQADPSSCDLVDGYYQVGTADQLAWFASLVNNGEFDACAQLTDDIELSGSWTGIGKNSSAKFNGVFDGQGHTITIALSAPTSSWGLFPFVSGTIRNLHVDGELESSYNKVGPLVGESFGGVFENIWSSVEIAATQGGDAAISGLIGRGSGANTTLRNCVFSGNINATGTGTYNCAAFVGWTGTGPTTMENCVVIGEINVDQSQGNGHLFGRNPDATTCTNCYYVHPYGTINAGATKVSIEDVENGMLCYRLNGDQSNIQWTQNIGEDPCPIPMLTSGIVYGVLENYGNAGDKASYAEFLSNLLSNEQEYCDNVLAQKDLVAQYEEQVQTLKSCANIEALVAAAAEIAPLRQSLKDCAAAYAAYNKKVEDTKTYLQEHDDFANEKRDALEAYLTDTDEPSAEYANGTAAYILEERVLTQAEIEAETKKVDLMLEEAILFAPASGTNITKKVVNPDFADGFSGWEGKLGNKTLVPEGGSMPTAECWNATMDMYQTITGLENGIYELQVNGAFRPYPYDNYYNTNYAAFLYANDVKNYFQANIEDMISVEDALDAFNCNITGDAPDYAVEDIEGNIVGYTMHGLLGCSYAFQAGRYQNSVLCQVTDGTLKIGMSLDGTGFQPDWLGFGNVQVIYHGSLDEAAAGLDNTLASMSARANTLVNVYESSFGDDYAVLPNFSQALKDELTAAMAAVGTTTDPAEKYALIQKFSTLFQQVYECKKAYIQLMAQADKIADLAGELGDILTNEQLNDVNALLDRLPSAYVDGTMTAEEAKQDFVSTLSFYPKKVNGAYVLNNAAEFMVFRTLVNGGENAANAVLAADIDLSAILDPSMGSLELNYAGIFDGQGHTLNVAMEASSASWGLFRGLNGTIKNLKLTGTMSTAFNKVGPLVGESFAGTIQNVWSAVDVISSQGGDGAISGLVGRGSADGTVIENCLYSGNISGNSYNSASLVGYAANTVKLKNCLFTGTIDLDAVQGNPYVMARNAGSVTCEGVYYVNLYGLSNPGSTQVTAEQVASGEICWNLNGIQNDIQWTQTLGQDAQPVPFLTQSVVYIHGNLLCDGITLEDGAEATYANTPDENIPDHQYVDGLCSVCGGADPNCAQLVDGFYQIGSVEQMKWFIARVNQGDNTINGQLTADIDMTGVEHEAIGNGDNHFKGILDGQFHTLTIDMTSTASSFGLIRHLDGTVKNLHLAGTMNAAHNKVGALVGESFAATIQNVWSSVHVVSTFDGDAAISGMIGRGSADGTLVENCLVSGTLEGAGYNFSSFIGWSGSKSTVRNSLFAGIILADDSQTNPYVIGRNPGNVTIDNVYFVNGYGEVNEGAVQLTAEQVANGEALALLGSQWSQDGDLCIPVPAAPEGFQYYMLEINSLQNNHNCIQISEFDLLVDGAELEGISVYGSQGAEGNANEGVNNLTDDNTGTKWCGNFGHTAYIFIDAKQIVTPEAYRMYTANDNEQFTNRSPMTWKLYGSKTMNKAASAEGWVLLDSHVDDYTMKNVNYTPFDFQIQYDWTGIEGITVTPVKGVQGTYNLMGQKVQQMQRGIYIVNGRKVLVK